MKKSVFLLFLAAVISYPLLAQKASNYTYKLDNGIVVKMEKCWGNIWIQQSQAEFKAGDDQHSVDVVVRPMGELLKPGSTTLKLLSAGKEVKMAGAPAGTYDLKINMLLSGKPGMISFEAPGIVVKPKMKTTVTVTIHDYQILIDEAAGANKGLAGYDSKVLRYKGNSEQNLNLGQPSFYAKGSHDKKLTPDAPANDLSGKIKPGTYDVCISIDISGKMQKVWLENFTMKPDVNYKITTNLNSGEITYAGMNRDVKQLLLYPAGTADKLQGVAKPDKSIEIIAYEPATNKYACRPGSFDALLVIGNGTKNEWKKGIVVRTGTRADVK
jgi:hypothetical protein